MIRTLGMSLGIALACCAVIAATFEDRRALRWSLDRYDLPLDPGAPVIEFTERLFPDTRECRGPDLTVLSDGTVVVRFGLRKHFVSSRHGHWLQRTPGRLVSRIEHEAMQKLLRFVLEENHLASWDLGRTTAEVQKAWVRQRADGEIVSSGLQPPYEVSVRIHVNGKVNTVFWRGSYLDFCLSGVKALQGLYAVMSRLDRMRLVILAGGKDAVKKWRTLANEALLSEYPGATPFEGNDLTGAGFPGPFSLEVSFARIDVEKGRAFVETNAVVRIEQGCEVNVRVTVQKRPF